MKEFFHFGAKDPIKVAAFVTVLSFLVFVLVCVAAGFFTRENLGGVVVMGEKILFLVFIALVITFEKCAN